MSQDDFVEYLDKGYVKFLGSFGSDELVAKFARCSFVNQDKEYTKKQDIGLINYLFELGNFFLKILNNEEGFSEEFL